MSTPPNPASGPDEATSEAALAPVGLIPAAGSARRLGRLPCSKELLPIGVAGTGVLDGSGDDPGDGSGGRIQVVTERLLAALGRGGIERALMVIDREKMDIPRHFADWTQRTDSVGRSAEAGPRALAFVPVVRSPSVPHSLAAALPFVGASPVALGFPDVLFRPDDAFARIESHRRDSDAALVLGLFPAADPTTTDMVEIAPGGQVLRIEVRPRRSALRLNWLIAVWDRRFSAWLTRRMNEAVPKGRDGGELQLGALFAEALGDGLAIEGVPFPDGAYLDLGTPEGYARALTSADPLRRPSRG